MDPEEVGMKAQQIVEMGIAVGKLKKAADGDGGWFSQADCKHLVYALQVMREEAQEAKRGRS